MAVGEKIEETKRISGLKTDGIVIGAEKKGGSVEVITTSQLHALIVGTTGSGKTTGFVDQNIAVLGKSKGKPSIIDLKSDALNTPFLVRFSSLGHFISGWSFSN